MSGALVRGGVGSLISLNAILPPHLRGSSDRQRKEAVAREYEAANPGAVVECDWELFDDADIALMNEPAREQALEDRRALATRKARAADMVETGELPTSEVGGDPERLREMLRRARSEIERTDSKAAPKRFEELAKAVNRLEEALGLKLSEYRVGAKVQHGGGLTEAQRKAYGEKVSAYRKAPKTVRLKSIAIQTDQVLAQMLFDVEIEGELRDALALKITELEMGATKD